MLSGNVTLVSFLQSLKTRTPHFFKLERLTLTTAVPLMQPNPRDSILLKSIEDNL